MPKICLTVTISAQPTSVTQRCGAYQAVCKGQGYAALQCTEILLTGRPRIEWCTWLRVTTENMINLPQAWTAR